MPLTADLAAALKAAAGPGGFIDAPDLMAPLLVEPRNLFRGRAPFVLAPANTESVAAIVRLCADAGVAMVPQGGNTGLVGGQIPMEGEVLISLKRLNAVRAVDPDNDTLTAEAGCILADIQERAAAIDRLFPLSLAAEGSCTIGGNLSTNAGGTHVLRYGTARDLALGLEVVLPDGRILNVLRGLRKNTAGYDLKHLFIGAEGTLGIITAAVLKLFPMPRAVETAFVAVESPKAALDLFHRLRADTGERVSAFELLPRRGLELVLRHMKRTDTRDPLAAPSPWYVLVELSASEPGPSTRTLLESCLERGLSQGLVQDAVLASGSTQAKALWHLRESLPDAQRAEGASIKCDVAVPLSEIPAFIASGCRRVLELCPGCQPLPFGHMGDGNIHFNIGAPNGGDETAFLARWDELSTAVHDLALAAGGTLSAEHGLGLLKRDEAARRNDTVELATMQAIKRLLDPKGLMNPGKVVTVPAKS